MADFKITNKIWLQETGVTSFKVQCVGLWKDKFVYEVNVHEFKNSVFIAFTCHFLSSSSKYKEACAKWLEEGVNDDIDFPDDAINSVLERPDFPEIRETYIKHNGDEEASDEMIAFCYWEGIAWEQLRKYPKYVDVVEHTYEISR